MDAVGPDVFTYEEMVKLIRLKTGSSSRLVHVSAGLAMPCSSIMGPIVRDAVLTRDEIEGLMGDLLVSRSDGRPRGITRLTDCLDKYAKRLGTGHTSELEGHYRQTVVRVRCGDPERPPRTARSSLVP